MLRARHPNYGQLMDLGLVGKRVVITGGSKGIGLGCAIALAREGCHIQIAARNQETLIGAESAIRECCDRPPNEKVFMLMPIGYPKKSATVPYRKTLRKRYNDICSFK